MKKTLVSLLPALLFTILYLNSFETKAQNPVTGLPSQWWNIKGFDGIQFNTSAGNKFYIGGRNSEGTIQWMSYPDQNGLGRHRYSYQNAFKISYEPWASNFVFKGSSGYGTYGNLVSWNTLMVIHNSGKVTIGNVSNPGDYRLYVERGILTERLKISKKSTSDWADYVFKDDYKLPTLQTVEAHINSVGHLPNVPSAEEIASDGGFEVGDMMVTQQEKIEELFLYVIELNKKIERLEEENRALKATKKVSE